MMMVYKCQELEIRLTSTALVLRKSFKIHANLAFLLIPSQQIRQNPSMNCFSDLGSCCRRAGHRSPPSVEADGAVSLPSDDRGGFASRRRRRLSGGRSKSGNGRHWRPGLTAISEDVVTPVDEVRTDRLRKKSASRTESIDRSYSFSHADEYYQRPTSMSMVMPMFSPTPFMF